MWACYNTKSLCTYGLFAIPKNAYCTNSCDNELRTWAFVSVYRLYFLLQKRLTHLCAQTSSIKSNISERYFFMSEYSNEQKIFINNWIDIHSEFHHTLLNFRFWSIQRSVIIRNIQRNFSKQGLRTFVKRPLKRIECYDTFEFFISIQKYDGIESPTGILTPQPTIRQLN